MTNYRRGAEAEYRAKKELEKEGYYVMRSAASHDVWDLIAMNDDELRLIQVKSIKGKYYESCFAEEIKKCERFGNHPEYTKFTMWSGDLKVVRKEFWIWLRRIPNIRKAHWKKLIL